MAASVTFPVRVGGRVAFASYPLTRVRKYVLGNGAVVYTPSVTIGSLRIPAYLKHSAYGPGYPTSSGAFG
jgi:hypothetical protein